MRRALLDVNVLIALLDSEHVDHALAMSWLDDEIGAGWASCAVTENGFVRILSQPRYPNPVAPGQAMALLSQARDGGHHEFWPCDVSLLDPSVIDRSRLHSARQITDAYLLALAAARGGRLVTFDRSVPITAVLRAATENLTVL